MTDGLIIFIHNWIVEIYWRKCFRVKIKYFNWFAVTTTPFIGPKIILDCNIIKYRNALQQSATRRNKPIVLYLSDNHNPTITEKAKRQMIVFTSSPSRRQIWRQERLIMIKSSNWNQFHFKKSKLHHATWNRAGAVPLTQGKQNRHCITRVVDFWNFTTEVQMIHHIHIREYLLCKKNISCKFGLNHKWLQIFIIT